MANKALQILLAEDNPDDAELLRIHLKREKIEADITIVADRVSYAKELNQKNWDIIISDYLMPGFDGMEALEILKESGKDIPFILISGTIGEEIAVNSVLSGANDYMLKDNLTRLKTSIQRELEAKRLRDEKKAQDIELEKRENRFQNLFRYSLDGIIISELNKYVISANKAASDILGYSREELISMSRAQLFDISDPETHRAFELREESGSFQGKLTMMKKDGTLLPVEVSSRIYEIASGEFQAATIFRDISSRLKSEEEIKKALSEKDIMLAEIHHRVKNNMAIISGMLQLQMDNSEDALLQRTLSQSISRIKSMALVHEMLYDTDSMSTIDMGDYVSALVHHLCENSGKQNIETRIEKESVHFDITKAIPCGLIINELVTNTLKHAFVNSDQGLLTISMKIENNIFSITVADNGPGMSDLGLIENSRTLGYAIINSLVSQLQARLDVRNNGGFQAEIHVPL